MIKVDTAALAALVDGTHSQPHQVLGAHADSDGVTVRVLRPDATEAWINLGRLFAENGDAAAAAECFQTALKLDPNDATSLYNLGVVAQDGGREDEAVGLYSRALELDPQLAEAHYNLATIFDQSGDPQLAIRHINAYRKLTR